MLILFLRAAVSPSSSVSTDRCSFFIPPAAPKNSQLGSMMRLVNPTLICSLQVAHPPVATSPRTHSPPPPIFRSRSTPCISPLSVPFGHFHLFPFSPYRRLSLARTHNPVSHCPHLSINAFVRSLISRVRVPFSLTAQATCASPLGHRPAKVNVARRPFHPKTVVRPNPKLRLFWVRYQTHELNIAVFS